MIQPNSTHARNVGERACDGQSISRGDTTDIGEDLVLVRQLPSSAQLTDALLGCVARAPHMASPGQSMAIGELSKRLVEWLRTGTHARRGSNNTKQNGCEQKTKRDSYMFLELA